MDSKIAAPANDDDNSTLSPLALDVTWLISIGAVMAMVGIWSWLSPRPEIGQVAVLWLPNAILAIALLRNWGRPILCFLAVLVFVGVGILPSIQTDTMRGALALLIVDIIEVGLLAGGLSLWFGKMFRLNTALNVTAFSLISIFSCLVGGALAALVSQIPLGTTVIETQAPLQVGVVWFTSDLATYFLVLAPFIALTGKGRNHFWSGIKQSPLMSILGAFLVMLLTFIGFALPQWLAAKTGLALGPSGLMLVAFPLASYLAFTRGPTIAALTGSAIGIPAIYATMSGFGPFGQGNAAANVFDMQATLIVCVFTLLLIGAMADQMRARSAALERALDEAIRVRQGR